MAIPTSDAVVPVREPSAHGIPATCEVALPIPAESPYTYAVPTSLADRIVPGARVVVPVRSRVMVGLVLDTAGGVAADGLKPVLVAPDSTPMVPSPLLELAGWVAKYYAAPPGLTLRAMLPAALWGTSTLVAVAVDGTRAPGGGGASRTVMDAIERAGGRATATALRRRRPD